MQNSVLIIIIFKKNVFEYIESGYYYPFPGITVGIIRTQVLFEGGHTIRKCQKMARQNTFKILLLNDANMIGKH